MRIHFVTHPRFQFSFILSFLVGIFILFLMIGGFTLLSLILLSNDPLLSYTQKTILLASTKELGIYLLLIFILFFVVCGGLAFYLSYKFVGPLARLETWLEERLDDKTNVPIKLRPGDELEKMSFILNRLILRKFGMRGHA